ncbi:MAG TPA: aspartate kinase, partial [Clostridiales bacterium]|nr:aspartate kinase [Clostridiales bacterium]
METIVCKFGGTSVADADAIKRVKSIAEADESRRFIVVSAPGKRFAGDTKVTDLFYTAVKAANENGRAEFEKVFSVIFARFRAIVAALFPYSSFPGKILAELNAIGRRVYEEKDEDFAAS